MRTMVGVFVFAFVVLLGTREADAKLVIINTGEDVIEIGQIKPDVRDALEAETAPDLKLGMVYSRFGLFWLDIWRWDKRYVLFADHQFWPITEEQAKEVSASMNVPITMYVPPGLMVILGIVVVGVGVSILGRKKAGDAPPSEPFEPDQNSNV